jgi:hypothetical protein
MVVKYKFTNIVYRGELFPFSLENSSCAYGGASFPIYTPPMRGSCVASWVLVSTIHTVSGCRPCISFYAASCFVTGYAFSGWCLVGCRCRSDRVLYCNDGVSGLRFQSV